ncbi:MAG: R3H domain-containing nucleic acid-binding protein, partial [Patescibacteria group bacterium]
MSLNKIKILHQRRISLGLKKTALRLIGHFDPKAKIELEAKEKSFYLNVDTDLAGLLIGRQGEVLDALQYVLRLILAKEIAEFTPLLIDIGGYRAARLKELEDLAKNLAKEVSAFGGTREIGPLNAFERRTIHLALQDIEGVESSSIGEEPDRRVII